MLDDDDKFANDDEDNSAALLHKLSCPLCQINQKQKKANKLQHLFIILLLKCHLYA